MPRSPIAERVQECVARVAASEGTPVFATRPVNRRQFLAGATGAIVGSTVWTLGSTRRSGAAPAPRIAVVGGGLAGLTCAYRLRQAGYTATVYEANSRFGGRCWTLRDAFADGQIVERGGELIDTNHLQIQQLGHELGLVFDDLHQGEDNGTEPFNFFDGTPYTNDEATRDIKQIWQAIHSDVSAAGYPTLYNSSTTRGAQLDNMSIANWIDANVPGGATSKLGQLLDVAYNIEYGAETSDQSSLNMLYLLGFAGQGQLRIFGKSNEKYHVRGGNDLVVQGLVNALAGQLAGSRALTRIARRSDGTWELRFRQGSSSVTVIADRVVLALPFSILRTLDIAAAGFTSDKLRAINELGMGRNAKLQLQFASRLWRQQGKTGDTFSDTGYQSSWEVTRAQPGASGILVDYTGGNTTGGINPNNVGAAASTFLAQLEPVVPGISAQWNGKAQLDWWPGNPFVRGAYSYWKVGQYTRIAGLERLQQGTCYFAGEHTSIDFQGYLNGAVETGERAAGEILADIKAGR